ncbi:MAG TPA: hypothetical protein VHA52_07625, partial [Candidatus Babeliaceae bacterium]|nr:hypothetical protein [Candidatus Babeliaceae bacterium]
EGYYFQHMAHLNKRGGVLLYDSVNFLLPFAHARNDVEGLKKLVKGQSPTYYVTMHKITDLIADIIKDIKEENIKFQIQGIYSITAESKILFKRMQNVQAGKKNVPGPLRYEPVRYHNCITWALEKLKNIGIPIKPCKRGWLLTTPKDYVESI